MSDAARPTSLVLGHLTFNIVWIPERKWLKKKDPAKCGLFHADIGLISMRLENDGRPMSEDNLREVLLHEILHACWFLGSMDARGALKDKDLEEWVVANITFPLVGVIMNNPDVFAYLMDKDIPVD